MSTNRLSLLAKFAIGTVASVGVCGLAFVLGAWAERHVAPYQRRTHMWFRLDASLEVVGELSRDQAHSGYTSTCVAESLRVERGWPIVSQREWSWKLSEAVVFGPQSTNIEDRIRVFINGSPPIEQLRSLRLEPEWSCLPNEEGVVHASTDELVRIMNGTIILGGAGLVAASICICMWAFIKWNQARLARIREARGECPRCGYFTDGSVRCPECGRGFDRHGGTDRNIPAAGGMATARRGAL